MKMRSKRKLFTMVVMISFSLLLFTACGKKVADEEQIKQELETNQNIRFLDEEEKIEELVIEKRQTDKEEKLDKVWCEVKISDAEVTVVKNVVLSYGLYDKEGWVLDDIDVASNEEWQVTPLVGISKEDAIASLYGQAVLIGNEEWGISKDNLLDVEIESQQTDLEAQKDILIFSVVIDDKIQKAEGKMQIEYAFDKQWKINNVLSNNDFSTSMKEEYALNVTEEDFVQKIEEKEVPIASTKQSISVSKDDILNFQISGQREENKGMKQVYECTYELYKAQLGIEVSTEISYWYEEGTGWNGYVTDISSTVETADIEGIWSGIYKDIFDGGAELSISELKEDGSVKAVYTFKPHDSAAASYELSGTWNQDTLQFVLEAGDWITEPKKITINNDKYDTIAELNVREERLQGSAQGNRQFRLYKETE